MMNPASFLKCDTCGEPKPEHTVSHHAFSTPEGRAMQQGREDLNRMDRDLDGVVDESEFIGAGGTAQSFQRYDKDGNGKLDADELTARALEINADAPSAPSQPTTLHEAVRKKDHIGLTQLLAAGADPEVFDEVGELVGL